MVRSRHADNLVAATVRVQACNRAGFVVASGTGWFVAPGFVVTCAHVVPNAPGHRYRILYQNDPIDADVLVREPDQGAEQVFAYPDVALLQVALVDHPAIPLATIMPQDDDRLYAYGCPVVDNGPIWEHMTMTVEGDGGYRPDGTDHVFIKTKYSQIREGASGSGAIDDQGELVGMLVQTRNPTLDVGGALVPTDAILRTLAAAGHDLAGANRAATANVNTLAAAERRLNWVLQLLKNDLSKATPEQWQSMLRTLVGNPPSANKLTVAEVALELINLELGELGDALEELAAASGLPEVRTILPTAAAFAWLAGRPLVEPDTAVRLAVERSRPRPRVVHLPIGGRYCVPLHTARAAVGDRWRLVELTCPDAETDPDTGLPATVVGAIRAELLRAIGIPAGPDEIDRMWRESGAEACRRKGSRLLFTLPADVADVDLVVALRREFAPVVFVLTGRSLSTKLLETPDELLALPSWMTVLDEQDVDDRYKRICNMIDYALRERPQR